ncbi:hypothetical protein ASG31_08380 [Chryseobacterium sp. Leaf404]|uniref:hypothetical protein n=1 Tax=unclassified Chryseobacterium TaxID=2593645 RepID=UPI0006FF9D37|nr:MULTISPECIES: hypothetical protein [unclassified Chryseobacterium]KQT17417.1 hypothetical protein ASG31_08380 [Chryseobacterium sp. Leaf404]
MKKSVGIGILAAMSIAGGLAGTGAHSVAESAQRAEAQKLVKEKTPNELPSSEKRNVSPEEIQKIASTKRAKTKAPLFASFDPGIPPKFYGMNFVKRGTHKRTNV